MYACWLASTLARSYTRTHAAGWPCHRIFQRHNKDLLLHVSDQYILTIG